jgi:hypothetical protein
MIKLFDGRVVRRHSDQLREWTLAVGESTSQTTDDLEDLDPDRDG